jgi:DNA-binding NarL/FixJ family response regulator
MSIADQPFPRHPKHELLEKSSERLPHKEIVRDHFQSTLAQRNGRIGHTSEEPQSREPLPPRSRSCEAKNLSPPLADHVDRAAPGTARDRKQPAAEDTRAPPRRPAVQFDKSDKPNEIPSRTAVINGIEHRARHDRLGIVVVHPHALFRDCFIRCLEISYSGYDIFAFARISDWADCSDRNSASPAVIVLFMDGTKASSAADLQFLDAAAANIPIVVMSDIEDANYVMRALKGGARGYIPTSLPFNVAVEAVRLVEAGGTFVPASSLEFGRAKKEMPQHTAELLTERQMMVVGALCRGMANKRIAFELNMSEHTVKVHLRHIMRKLKARNRTEVAVLTKDYFQA